MGDLGIRVNAQFNDIDRCVNLKQKDGACHLENVCRTQALNVYWKNTKSTSDGGLKYGSLMMSKADPNAEIKLGAGDCAATFRGAAKWTLSPAECLDTTDLRDPKSGDNKCVVKNICKENDIFVRWTAFGLGKTNEENGKPHTMKVPAGAQVELIGSATCT